MSLPGILSINNIEIYLTIIIIIIIVITNLSSLHLTNVNRNSPVVLILWLETPLQLWILFCEKTKTKRKVLWKCSHFKAFLNRPMQNSPIHNTTKRKILYKRRLKPSCTKCVLFPESFLLITCGGLLWSHWLIVFCKCTANDLITFKW